MNSNIKLILGIVLGLAIAPALAYAVDSSIIIDMVVSQVDYPFEINNSLGTLVAGFDTEGQLLYERTTIENGVWDAGQGKYLDTGHLFWNDYVEYPNTAVTTFAESGAGVYQWTHTVTADDLPNGIPGFDTFAYHPVIAWQFENRDTVTRVVNIKAYINDVLIEPADTRSTATTHYAWGIMGNMGTGADYLDESWKVEVGDVIGIKYWISTTDTTNPVDFERIIIWIAPAISEVRSHTVTWDTNTNGDHGLQADVSHILPTPVAIQELEEFFYIESPDNNYYFDANSRLVLNVGTHMISTGTSGSASSGALATSLKVPAIAGLSNYNIVGGS